ncbi:MAG: hypothetical protein M1812_005516 [Candelaria pacifica]|nr:MAG: hypothetical protein M1812_005516 [Candelaria pacifica]
MFHQGDLQSGIALAVQQSKLVVCFNWSKLDATDKSRIWEEKYLKHPRIAQSLQDKAILLRIEADSQGASFLSAFCPIDKAPVVAVINNGQLLETLNAETTRDELLSRLEAVLGERSTRIVSSESSSQSSQEQYNESEIPPIDEPSVPRAEPPQAPSHADTSTAVQDLLSDRRIRLEAERKQREAAEKAERIAKAKTRREEAEAEAAQSASGSLEKKEPSYAEQQRKRQRDARQERERILRLVENDKVERKEKEERRKALAREDANGDPITIGSSRVLQPQSSNSMEDGPLSGSNQCAIQVRLPDGSTIKRRFPVNSTLRTGVRHWVDNMKIDGDTPYTFKQILIPLPNRSITISEEEESLQTLGLAPSATLVMIPVQEYTDAYGNTGQGLLSRGASVGYGILSTGVGIVTGALRPLLGAVGQVAPTQESEVTTNLLPGQLPLRETRDDAHRRRLSDINFRTLRDQQDSQENRELYNGNQLNFEPNPNDGDKQD